MSEIVKSGLIKQTWENTGKTIEKKKIEYIINNFINTIGSEIKNGNNVKIEGLGSFHICYRKAYTGKDVRSGMPVRIPETTYIKFTPSPKIKPDR